MFWVRDSIARSLLVEGGVNDLSDYSWGKVLTNKEWKRCSGNLFLTRDEITGYYPDSTTLGDIDMQEKSTCLDARKLCYRYQDNSVDVTTYIYPDTLCWALSHGVLGKISKEVSFMGSYGDAFSTCYFNSEEFKDEPVFGIGKMQVKAYEHWWNMQHPKDRIYLELNKDRDYTSLNLTELIWNLKYWLITEHKYRKFLSSVADSIVMYRIGSNYNKMAKDANLKAMLPPIDGDVIFTKDKNGASIFPYQINWEKRDILKSLEIMNNPLVKQWISDLYDNEKHLWNFDKMKYQTSTLNLERAALPENRYNYSLQRYGDSTNTEIASRKTFYYLLSYPLLQSHGIGIGGSATSWVNINEVNIDVSKLSYFEVHAYYRWYVANNRSKIKGDIPPLLFPNKEQQKFLRSRLEQPNLPSRIQQPTTFWQVHRLD